MISGFKKSCICWSSNKTVISFSVHPKDLSPGLHRSTAPTTPKSYIMATFDEIKSLCCNFNLPESKLVLRLKSILIDPEVLATTDDHGWTLLHIAARFGRFPEFCKVLIELRPALVKTRDNHEELPLHTACAFLKVELAKYLLEIYPDSINIAAAHGSYPLHMLSLACGIVGSDENGALVLLELLLKHDRGAVSTPDWHGFLPLHLASYDGHLAFVKLIFDANPGAIFDGDSEHQAPLGLARYNNADIVSFLETQWVYYSQLSIHEALRKDDISFGIIKLMIAAQPASIIMTDDNGCIPLHLACQHGHLKIVEYLVGLNGISLTTTDNGGNLPLHHACLAGKPDIVNFTLKTTDCGVSAQNGDGKLPIQLFLCNAICVRDLQHMDAVYSLIRANPDDSMEILSPGLFR